MNKKKMWSSMQGFFEKLENAFFDVRRYSEEEWKKVVETFNPEDSEVSLVVFSDKYNNRDFCLMVKSQGEKIYFSPFKKSLRLSLSSEDEERAEYYPLSAYDEVVLTDHEIHIRIYIKLKEGEKRFKAENIFGEIKIQR